MKWQNYAGNLGIASIKKFKQLTISLWMNVAHSGFFLTVLNFTGLQQHCWLGVF
jgi:hypothetical protein